MGKREETGNTSVVLATYRVTGLSPLLQHNPAGMGRGDGGAKTAAERIPSPEAEAEAGTYRQPDGALYHPANAFRTALLAGAKGQSIKRAGLPGILAGAVFNDADRMECGLLSPADGNPLRDYEIDRRRAVVGRAGVVRARPRINAWATEISLIVDTRYVPVDLVTVTLAKAGRTIGIGDFRPEKKGWFGRFAVELANVETYEE